MPVSGIVLIRCFSYNDLTQRHRGKGRRILPSILSVSVSLFVKQSAEFITRGGNYFVKDCSSTNGTYIEGERISSNTPREMHDGDTVKLADLEMIFRLGTR